MRRALIMVSFFAFVSMAFGQEYEKVAGYLGKRFSIGAGMSMSSSRHPQKPLEASERSKDKITINKIWRMDAQYAVGTYNLFGLFLGSQRTSARLETSGYRNVYWGTYSNDSREHLLIGIFGTPEIKDFCYGGYFKKYLYNKGAIAPIGSYYKFGVSIHNYQIDFSRITFLSYTDVGYGKYENREHKFEFGYGKMSRIELLAGIGKTRPITDRILLDYSMEAGLIPNLLKNPASINGPLPEGNTAAEFALYQIKKRIYQVNYVKFTIGCSLLLF